MNWEARIFLSIVEGTMVWLSYPTFLVTRKTQYELASFLKQNRFCGKSWRRFKQLVNLVLLKMYMQSNVDHDHSIHRNHRFSHDPRDFFHPSSGYYYYMETVFISSFYSLINFSVLFIYVYIYFEEEKSRLDPPPPPADIKLIFFSTERSRRFSTGLKIR